MNSPPQQPPTDTDIHCPECDYNLTGATEDRCPWCGWMIDERILSLMVLEQSNVRRIGAILACLACGLGSLTAVMTLVRHGTRLSLLDALASVGVLLAAAGHLCLAGLLIYVGRRWPIYRSDLGTIFRFVGWFSAALGLIGATELLGSRNVQGVPVAATLEFALAAVFYTLPGFALLVMRMASFREPGDFAAAFERRDKTRAPESDGCPFLIDVSGRFDEERVTQSWSDKQQPTTPTMQAAVEQAWSAAVTLAQSDDFTLYDGELVSLRDAKSSGQNLNLELSRTTYKSFVGTNMNPHFVANEANRSHLANPLGISASVITRDGFIAYGRRGRRVAFQTGWVHPFGGMVDLTDRRPDGTVDLFGAILRELQEEAGITRDEVSDLFITGLVRDSRLMQPELLFDVWVNRSRRELEASFDPERSDGEHSGIEFLHDDPEAAIPSLSRFDKITPITEAAYLLHGRHTWGAEWFEQTCYLRFGALPGHNNKV